MYVCMYVSIYLSIYLSNIYLSIYLSIYCNHFTFHSIHQFISICGELIKLVYIFHLNEFPSPKIYNFENKIILREKEKKKEKEKSLLSWKFLIRSPRPRKIRSKNKNKNKKQQQKKDGGSIKTNKNPFSRSSLLLSWPFLKEVKIKD